MDHDMDMETLKQELLVDGHHLIEKKQKTLRYDHGFEIDLALVHVRTIDDKSYKVTEITIICHCDCHGGSDSHCICDCANGPILQVETEMAENEVKQFEEDWTRLWNPDFTKKEIKNLPPQ